MDSFTCDVYLGTEKGLFKGVNTVKKMFKNLNPLTEFSKDNEISSLCWSDSLENQIYVGQKNKTVKLFNCKSKMFTQTTEYDAGEGDLRGIEVYNGQVITATESGIVKLWSADNMSEQAKINAGEKLYRLHQNLSNPEEIATGGEENDLKIWNLQKPEQPTFRAKNVRNNFLDLRIPVWVTDMKFFPDSSKIATCTRHHHVRLYDPKSSQRRPVVDMEFETFPLVSLSLAHQEWQVVVGSSRGRMALIDLRKKRLVHVYKGFAGSIRCVKCHPNLPIVASCGLDRFLRIHDLNTHKLLTKIYLKSRLNTLLLRTIPEIQEKEEEEISQDVVPVNSEKQTLKEIEEKDALWDNMKIVKEKSQSKKRSALIQQTAPVKRKRSKLRK